MVKVLFFIKMEKNTKVTGARISLTERVVTDGLAVRTMREITSMEKSMEWVNLSGKIKAITRVNGCRISCKVKVLFAGQMGECIEEIGRIT
jgi:hypothetical protein